MCFNRKPSTSAVSLLQKLVLDDFGFVSHPLDRHLLPRHWYVLLHTLESLLMDLQRTGTGSSIEAQNFRSAKGLLSLSIVFASPKCSHARTTSVLEALLGTAGILHGKIIWIDVHRMRRLNTVYVKFCVYTGYVYIGETLTGARFYQHESATNGGYTSQHVHRVISRLGSPLYDTLAIDFPSSTNRKHVELALIKHFDRYGKDLLNVFGRSSSYTLFGDVTRSSRARYFRETIRRTIPSTTPRSSKPFLRLIPPTPRILLRRRPALILYGGGLGGVTEGLCRCGTYDVLLVVEYDPVTADIHQDRFPSIHVLVYEFGKRIDDALCEIARFIPRNTWPQLFVQASPPCRMLSANVTVTDAAAAMHQVHLTLDLIEHLSPRGFVIENVKAMLQYLIWPRTYYTATVDMSFWAPQR